MIRLITIVILISMLSSCIAHYHIIVHQDGSAAVNVDRDYAPTVIKRHHQSDVISCIDTNTFIPGRVAFKISNVDSLGNYLPFHPPGFFQFRMKGNSLTVTDGHTDAFRDNHLSCCSVYMLIKFNKDIQNLKSASGKAKKKDDRTVKVFKTRRQLIKGKKKTDLTIKIE